MITPTIIQLLSAPVGGGKTYAACEYAVKMAKAGQKILIAQPSRDLIKQTFRQLKTLNSSVIVTPFYSKQMVEGVTPISEKIVKKIIDHFANPALGGEILLITHEAFSRVGFFQNSSNWHLIYDEAPQITYHREFKLGETSSLVLNLFDDSGFGNSYSVIHPRNHGTLDAIARNITQDEVLALFQQFAWKLLDSNHTIWCLTEQLERFRTNGGSGEKSIEHSKLSVFSLLQPTIFQGFSEVIVMGAHLHESLFYRYWTQHADEFNVKFVDCKKIKPRLSGHTNGWLLKIYFASEADWSKTFRDKIAASVGENRFSVLDVMGQLVSDFYRKNEGKTEFVWMANLDVPMSIFHDDGKNRLPNSPHGLNNFDHMNHAVILSALNFTPAHGKFMELIAGILPHEVKTAVYREAVYQACGRISLRNPANTDPKTVIVMDESTALWLENVFPGSSVHRLPESEIECLVGKSVGQPRKHASNAARKAAEKIEKKSRLLDGMNNLKADQNFWGSIFPKLKARIASTIINVQSADDFIELLAELHKRTVEKKDANYLISPAFFDPDIGDKSRGLENVVLLRGIWLDNDGGDLTPARFLKMYPRTRMVIFNSYSSTKKNLRWRVFIPTTVALTAEAHREIIDQIKQKLANTKFYGQPYLKKNPNAQKHGFDDSKFNSAALFYAPCQANHPDDSFFEDYLDGRTILDPYEWIGRSMVAPKPAIIQTRNPDDYGQPGWSLSTQQQDKVQNALSVWKISKNTVGKGNRAFFILAISLFYAGLHLAEIQSTLQSEAATVITAKSRASRLQEIPDLMVELFNKRRK